jgi:hypothetical protein
VRAVMLKRLILIDLVLMIVIVVIDVNAGSDSIQMLVIPRLERVSRF